MHLTAIKQLSLCKLLVHLIHLAMMLSWHIANIAETVCLCPGTFLAIFGRDPRAFLIGKISDVNPEKFSEYSKLIIHVLPN